MANIILDVHMKEFCFVCVFGYRCCELGNWSETSKAELRVPFEIKECNLCKTLFKSCSGFYGNGKRGYLRGFYDSIEDPDCCFMCQ